MKYVEDVPHTWDFDSSIDAPYLAEDRIHFEFAIILKLYMEPLNPPGKKMTYQAPDYNGNKWPALRWNRASWIHFKEQYVKRVLEVWDKAFILIPPRNYDGFIWPDGGKRRNLLCRLRIKIQEDSPRNSHAQIRVVRLANPSSSYFRSDSGLYDSADIDLQRVRWAPDGASFLHNTPAHEVGHLLGFYFHVGAGNPGCVDEGSSACYGSNLHERMNVMGAGSMLDLENARPWLRRIYEHTPPTSTSDWKVDWASTEAQLRGLEGFEVDEKHKQPYKPPKPGIIDL